MKILVIGGGGREHALVWKLSQSPLAEKIWCTPGNGGISQLAECVPANLADVKSLADLATNLGADLTVVGPEQPLVDGVADVFSARGLRLIGPSMQCARLEGSKIFAKEFLNRHGIPTAGTFGIYEDAAAARAATRYAHWPLVLKADGLCAGKGVLVANSFEEAASFIDRVLAQKEFGEGGARLLIEEALSGQELSFIVLSDGTAFVPLVPTRDHKRALDGDQGPNTGGMGAYSSDDIVSPALQSTILENIVRPAMAGLARDGCIYQGFLYFGLMLTPQGPKVLEFNCRLGDPETQAILPRMDFDLVEALEAVAERRLGKMTLKWKPGASVCVVMASGGYPGKYEAGKQIHGLEKAGAIPGVVVFHAGTKREVNSYYTCSGRVLGIAAAAESVEAACQKAYAGVAQIDFSGAHFRRDIALAARRPANVAGS